MEASQDAEECWSLLFSILGLPDSLIRICGDYFGFAMKIKTRDLDYVIKDIVSYRGTLFIDKTTKSHGYGRVWRATARWEQIILQDGEMNRERFGVDVAAYRDWILVTGAKFLHRGLCQLEFIGYESESVVLR